MSKEEREACVDAFGELMKAKLSANAHKGDRGGWRRDTPKALLRRLREEVRELADLIDADFDNDDGTDPDFTAKVAGEAADVGNFAMFIADVAGAIDVSDDLAPMTPEEEKFAAESFDRFLAIKHGTDRLEVAEAQVKDLTIALGDAVARVARLEKERVDTRELERDHQHLSSFVDDTARALADFTTLEAAGTCDKPHEALVRDLRDAAARLAIERIKR